jgi:two-component system, OmpR family, phosphate regulon response regulator OmpR
LGGESHITPDEILGRLSPENAAPRMRTMSTAAAAVADDAPHLLLVDDDRRIRDLLSRFLISEGYRVTTAETAADARAKLEGLRFDLLILDVMMPGETGFELARDLRASSNVPIIMLTARDEKKDRIEGLTIGADDYVGKPFEPTELSLRIANVLRRARPATTPAVESVRFGDFRFHLARGELKRGEEIVRLTDRERDMLRLLAATPGETVPRLALAGNGGAIGERAVDVQVNRLRRKIEHDPANPLLVQTVRGVGYRLVTVP